MVRSRIVGILFVLALVIWLVWNIFKDSETPLTQINVVIDGDPVIIASQQREQDRLVIVTIPASFATLAVHGLGTYPIRSLWQLGTIQGSSGLVLSQSIEELLALPIQWYIGGYRESLDTDAKSRIVQIFSLRSLLRVVSGEIKTNMPLATFLRLSWRLSVTNRDRIAEIPLGASAVTGEPQPDGTILPLVSTDAVDTVLGDTFEEASIRGEKLTVAVYNTTTTSGLAERAARIINRIGGNVVRIGNEERTIERCQIRANQEHLGTTTSRMLSSIFTCDRVIGVPDSYADVIVALGRGYESRFVP